MNLNKMVAPLVARVAVTMCLGLLLASCAGTSDNVESASSPTATIAPTPAFTPTSTPIAPSTPTAAPAPATPEPVQEEVPVQVEETPIPTETPAPIEQPVQTEPQVQEEMPYPEAIGYMHDELVHWTDGEIATQYQSIADANSLEAILVPNRQTDPNVWGVAPYLENCIVVLKSKDMHPNADQLTIYPRYTRDREPATAYDYDSSMMYPFFEEARSFCEVEVAADAE